MGPGTTLLLHAAAGGVGLIASPVGPPPGGDRDRHGGQPRRKPELARAHGCEHPIVYTREDFAARVKEITGGRGVDVVYDSVGQTTFMKSLDCLRPMGMLVLFGQSSGPVPPFDLSLLAQKGSLFITRPTLMTYTARREDLLAHARDLFEVVRNGAVKIEVARTYPLSRGLARPPRPRRAQDHRVVGVHGLTMHGKGSRVPERFTRLPWDRALLPVNRATRATARVDRTLTIHPAIPALVLFARIPPIFTCILV